MGFWPLAGGVGHGRIRISMVWRSLQLQAPTKMLGWDYGTVEVQPHATASSDLPSDLQSTKLKFRTNISSGKMHADKDGEQVSWTAKKEKRMRLAVQKRYSSCLSIAFKKKGVVGEDVAAFAVLWLKDGHYLTSAPLRTSHHAKNSKS